MNWYTKIPSSPRRRVARGALLYALTASVIAVAACETTDFLTVEDPDIIRPDDVQSAAGAEAVRTGALRRLNGATSGGEGLFLLGGLFADEWINGDSFINRQEIDQRDIPSQNSRVTDANRDLSRARLSAEQAVQFLGEFKPSGPAWEVAEMHFVQAYVVNLMAENFCSGLPFSTVTDSGEQYGEPTTMTDALERSLGHADDGLALLSGGETPEDERVRNALQVTRGRILMNLDRPGEAAAEAADVPTSFAYDMLHSANTTSNEMWSLNLLNRRYSVGDGEGVNGLNFATADDPRLPVCIAGDEECSAFGATNPLRDDLSQPLHVQLRYPTEEAPVTIAGGIEARLIEAEAQLREGDADGWLATLNALRTTVDGLEPLTDPGSDAARVDLLFRERAFWHFGRGHRVGDLRRLVRQYGRSETDVFPVGAWHKGGNYGTAVTMPIPQAEENNPNVPAGQLCLDRNA